MIEMVTTGVMVPVRMVLPLGSGHVGDQVQTSIGAHRVGDVAEVDAGYLDAYIEAGYVEAITR
jgi:hypothetical protein